MIGGQFAKSPAVASALSNLRSAFASKSLAMAGSRANAAFMKKHRGQPLAAAFAVGVCSPVIGTAVWAEHEVGRELSKLRA